MTKKALKAKQANGNPDGLEINLKYWDLNFDFDWDWTLEPLKPRLVTIKVTVEQKAIIDQALEKCRKYTDFPDMMEGRALELICAEWLQDPNRP